MEKRKDSLNSIKLCRFCLTQDGPLNSLYDRTRMPKNSVTLPLKILSSVSIEVFPSDKMPLFICDRCKHFMDLCYEYKQICRQADETILQYIQNGTALESIVWPSPLVKAYRYAAKNISEHEVVKTVIEGGATVQVTSQETSDSEEDDENVYNIKIGDGSDEGSKSGTACIKVVTNNDKLEITKEKPKQARKETEDVNEGNVYKRGPPGAPEEGCWPCDECDCTYPLQQLLELHRKQKHRARTVQCDQCDSKFFTKYDLITHQLRHSDETPFQCVACGKKFKRLILLKRHEKVNHSDLPQHVCPNCPATFLSSEELEAHQKRHLRHPDQPYICSICHKKFHAKATLQRHKDVVHGKTLAFVCEYCPQRFSTISKLVRHVRTHAGERAYPCKYCNKSFMKSHHYTRHLRLKHRETIRTSRGPFGETDQYRCEQCEDSFATQDEVIYHSAIHATQNLTCPLCQEKFENVDAVTAHIKSHVNGMEFMCDLCELVFTTKEKLDNHITIAHEDEIRHEQELGLDESSMEVDADDDDDDDNDMNVKEEDDHMVVEIKKPDNFLISDLQGDCEEKINNTNSEESESETTYAELSTVDTIAMINKEVSVKETQEKIQNKPSVTAPAACAPLAPAPAPAAPVAPLVTVTVTTSKAADKNNEGATANILRKAEEIKRKVVQQPETVTDKKEKARVESSNSVGANDKSLRLLEKELQELKRTNSRSEIVKTSAKSVETLRARRPQLHTSTPKARAIEEKKSQILTKSPALEKKLPERRVVTKENKEPKETKETKSNNNSIKEEKEKDVKEKDTPKTNIKNGANDKSGTEEGIRRSTRPSKIKDYAKMIRERSQVEDGDNDDSDDVGDAEYKEVEKIPENRPKQRRSSVKPSPKNAPTPPVGAQPPRKRGRPRKEQPKEVPAKIKKSEENEEEESKDENAKSDNTEMKLEEQPTPAQKMDVENKTSIDNSNADLGKPTTIEQKVPSGALLVSPTGQTLKKVPIKALPPGVKPLPLPVNARPVGAGELCEMQIGKKVVKVQKIVMTKAEVEAMAKKGLVEMKDGTMVLKQGIKIPTADPMSIKSTLVGEGEIGKESPNKKEKATPTRCDFGEET